MRRLLLIPLFAAACGGGTPSAATPPIEVRGAWARAADSGTVTAVYLAIVNHEKTPLAYTGASSPAAYSASLHETMSMNGMVHMMPLDTAQTIAAGDSLVLAEGAKHLMLSGLWRKLAAGDTLPLTLSFADGRTIAVTVAVKAP